jgi:TRAP-type C4-dicarboxylate transport system permease small subunit
MKVISAVSRWLIYLSMALVLILMLLTVSDVFMRFVFNNPITGTAEMAMYIMVCLVCGMALCALRGEHIVVDILMSRFSPRVQAIVDCFNLLASLAIVAVITWQGFINSLWERKFNYLASVMFPVPSYPFWWIYLLGCTALCLATAALVIRKIKEAAKG